MVYKLAFALLSALDAAIILPRSPASVAQPGSFAISTCPLPDNQRKH